MKKLMYIMSACVLTLSLAACNNQTKETVTETKTETIKEVSAPKKEEAAPKEVTVEKVEVKKKKSTSVKIGPNGGSLETDQIDIEINK